jgi:protein phosphatase PTC7
MRLFGTSGSRNLLAATSWSFSPTLRSVSISRVLAFGIGISRLPLASSVSDTCAIFSVSGSLIWSRNFHQSSSTRSISNFSFKVAASFSGKGQKFRVDQNVFNFNPDRISETPVNKKRNRPKSGQDSYFISPVGNTESIAFGIVSQNYSIYLSNSNHPVKADGVGGWADSGVDPADFAHGFCKYMAEAAEAYTSSEGTYLSPRDLMETGYEMICRDPSVPAGGSTACVAVAHSDGVLDVAK